MSTPPTPRQRFAHERFAFVAMAMTVAASTPVFGANSITAREANNPATYTERASTNYRGDVFRLTGSTVNKWRDQEILPALSAKEFAAAPSRLEIKGREFAQQLNDEHERRHELAYPNKKHIPPHNNNRLVVQYSVPRPTNWERSASSPLYTAGDPVHPHVFVTPPGTQSLKQAQKAVKDLNLLAPPVMLADVTAKPNTIITKSKVHEGDGMQYMMERSHLTIKPRDFTP